MFFFVRFVRIRGRSLKTMRPSPPPSPSEQDEGDGGVGDRRDRRGVEVSRLVALLSSTIAVRRVEASRNGFRCLLRKKKEVRGPLVFDSCFCETRYFSFLFFSHEVTLSEETVQATKKKEYSPSKQKSGLVWIEMKKKKEVRASLMFGRRCENTPDVGLEPTTTRLRVLRSTELS